MGILQCSPSFHGAQRIIRSGVGWIKDPKKLRSKGFTEVVYELLPSSINWQDLVETDVKGRRREHTLIDFFLGSDMSTLIAVFSHNSQTVNHPVLTDRISNLLRSLALR